MAEKPKTTKTRRPLAREPERLPDGRFKAIEYDAQRHPVMAALLAARGATRERMAPILGISMRTLDNWVARYPEFREAVLEGRSEALAQVEGALFRRAMGCEYEETEISEGTRGRRVKRTRKFIPPDTLALIFYLKHADRDRYGDRPDDTDDGTLEQLVGAMKDAAKAALGSRPAGGNDGGTVHESEVPAGEAGGRPGEQVAAA